MPAPKLSIVSLQRQLLERSELQTSELSTGCVLKNENNYRLELFCDKASRYKICWYDNKICSEK